MVSLPAARASTQIKKADASGGIKLKNSTNKTSNQFELSFKGSRHNKNVPAKEMSLKPIINLNLSDT